MLTKSRPQSASWHYNRQQVKIIVRHAFDTRLLSSARNLSLTGPTMRLRSNAFAGCVDTEDLTLRISVTLNRSVSGSNQCTIGFVRYPVSSPFNDHQSMKRHYGTVTAFVPQVCIASVSIAFKL